jgi:hypothetical protein
LKFDIQGKIKGFSLASYLCHLDYLRRISGANEEQLYGIMGFLAKGMVDILAFRGGRVDY